MANACPRGSGVEPFEMKPSFAYSERILERMSEVAHLQAERHMLLDETRALAFCTADGAHEATLGELSDAALGRGIGGVGEERAEDVSFELCEARLHDMGVVLLPFWIAEYTLLGKGYRAFISGLPPKGGVPTVAGAFHDGVPQAGDAAVSWSATSELRRNELDSNSAWKVQRFWQDEVRRVMPDFQKARERNASGGGFKGFRAGGGDCPSADDYELLGLPRTPPPTSEAVAAAFRARAMTHHPDILAQRGLSEAELTKATGRFQKIVEAHSRLRRQFPKFLDSTRPV
jgi:DnaJ-domain-containing protein 1